MARGVIIELIPKEGADFSKVIADIANKHCVDLSGFEVRKLDSPIDYFLPDFIKHITQYGFYSLLCRQVLKEDVIGPEEPPRNIEALLRGYVQGIGVKEELIITDAYFYEDLGDETYPERVEQVLVDAVKHLKAIHIVTKPNMYKERVKSEIEKRLQLLNPSIELVHKTSNSFHDRFWINPNNQRGFFTGTSLNGLGKRYALADYLREDDVVTILSALSKEDLFTR